PVMLGDPEPPEPEEVWPPVPDAFELEPPVPATPEPDPLPAAFVPEELDPVVALPPEELEFPWFSVESAELPHADTEPARPQTSRKVVRKCMVVDMQ
ncbi:MAG: hypothetical protein WBY94_00960, partial [Polyangiaceae bacterium]